MMLYVQNVSMYSDSGSGVEISTFCKHCSADIQMQLLEPVIIPKPSLHLESGKLGCFPGVAVEEKLGLCEIAGLVILGEGVNLSGFDDHFLHGPPLANGEGLKLLQDSETFQVVNTSSHK